ITKTNLEAAEGVVNQLRLRDIGGIIVIDFIDMARARNRDAVLKVLRKALDEDRTKTFVVEISPLGLVEMTRQNVTDGVREIMSKTCPVCHGEGVIKSEETIAIGIARHLRHMIEEAGKDGPEAYLLRINPKVSAWFTADGARELHALEEQTGRYFHFEGSEGLPLDYFAVTMEGPREEIEQHAVPFRAGEEVHVHIVEPHMYNPDDGVAKVDGYLISVTNGIAFVGEKKLVRIEEAGRTAAVAVLTGSDAEAAEAAAEEREKEREKADERARRSAAAKRGAAARKAREEAAKVDEKPKRSRTRAKKADDEPAKKPRAAQAKADDAGDETKSRGRRRRRGKPEEDGAGVEADAVKALTEEDSPDAGTAPAAADDAAENGDALSSRPRRRGRRGGRRRSRAKASADAESSE
ncbi:MAG TPA: ribonuclease E/G, partial [Solirubrobacteraceae bacterium]|nr:ribonuclease E/G [Solirubrobacteraceae bacterium]